MVFLLDAGVLVCVCMCVGAGMGTSQIPASNNRQKRAGSCFHHPTDDEGSRGKVVLQCCPASPGIRTLGQTSESHCHSHRYSSSYDAFISIDNQNKAIEPGLI